MTRTLITGIFGIVLGLAIAGGMQVVAASSSHHAVQGGPAAARTIIVITKSRELGLVDTGPRGTSQGDMRVLNAPVYDASGTRQLGRFDTAVVLTDRADDPGEKFQITLETGVFALTGGSIAIQGTVRFDNLTHLPMPGTLAITGGTGAYEGVRGQLSFTSKGSDVVNTLHLLP